MKKHKKIIYIVLFVALILVGYVFLSKKSYKYLYDDVLILNFFQFPKIFSIREVLPRNYVQKSLILFTLFTNTLIFLLYNTILKRLI